MSLDYSGTVVKSFKFSLLPTNSVILDHLVLIREGKTLYPFLSTLRTRRSVRFGIVKS
jgi:hypothetical protein